MKMNTLRKKNTLKYISFIWLIGILSSCGTYYELNSAKFAMEKKLFTEFSQENTVVFVHSSNGIIQLKDARIINKTIEATIEPTNPAELAFYHRIMEKRSKGRYFDEESVFNSRQKARQEAIQVDTLQMESDSLIDNNYYDDGIIHQVHIHSGKISKIDNKVSIQLGDVFHAEIFKKASSGAHVFTVIAITLLSLFLLWIIILGILCNCPHVYVQNGESYVYTNTLFTGAVSQGLERFDYKSIPDFNPSSTSLSMQIRNEDQEIQHTNLIQLIAAYHDPSFEVLTDQNGVLYSISKAQKAISTKDQEGKNLSEELSERDGSTYHFDTPSKNGMASSFLSFNQIEEGKNAKLILSVKNSDWAGLIHQEFNTALGNKHQQWTAKNRKKSGAKQNAELKNAGIPLQVYVKKNNKWIEIQSIQPVGNASMQSLVVPIDAKYISGKQVEIRIDGGFKFWELDYAAIDFSAPKNFEVKQLTPTSVSGDSAFYQALQKDDQLYMSTASGYEAVSVQFEGLKPQNRTLFVQSKGYYLRQDVQKGKPDWMQMAKMTRSHGIARFSQDIFLRYLNDFGQLSKN
jgi:hypothetical protein